MKHLFAQTFLLLALFGASAHDVSAMAGKYSVKGRVVDTDTKKPIEFASVVLIAVPDSTIKSSGRHHCTCHTGFMRSKISVPTTNYFPVTIG